MRIIIKEYNPNGPRNSVRFTVKRQLSKEATDRGSFHAEGLEIFAVHVSETSEPTVTIYVSKKNQ